MKPLIAAATLLAVAAGSTGCDAVNEALTPKDSDEARAAVPTLDAAGDGVSAPGAADQMAVVEAQLRVAHDHTGASVLGGIRRREADVQRAGRAAEGALVAEGARAVGEQRAGHGR